MAGLLPSGLICLLANSMTFTVTLTPDKRLLDRVRHKRVGVVPFSRVHTLSLGTIHRFLPESQHPMAGLQPKIARREWRWFCRRRAPASRE